MILGENARMDIEKAVAIYWWKNDSDVRFFQDSRLVKTMHRPLSCNARQHTYTYVCKSAKSMYIFLGALVEIMEIIRYVYFMSAPFRES